jgi:hypothetical protein
MGCNANTFDCLFVGKLCATVCKDYDVWWDAAHLSNSVSDFSNRGVGFHLECDGVAAANRWDDFNTHLFITLLFFLWSKLGGAYAFPTNGTGSFNLHPFSQVGIMGGVSAIWTIHSLLSFADKETANNALFSGCPVPFTNLFDRCNDKPARWCSQCISLIGMTWALLLDAFLKMYGKRIRFSSHSANLTKSFFKLNKRGFCNQSL